MTLLVLAAFRRPALAAALVATTATAAGAQRELTHTEDASPVPVGMLRLRVISSWTRYDHAYGANGLTSINDPLSADPLGSAQFPRLAPIEASVQALAADPRTRLSLGRLVTGGDARIVTAPISMEYGLTSRLTIGVVVPVVQTRRTVTLDVNSRTGTPANMGFVPIAQRAAAASANATAASSYAAAAQQLADLIARCQASPSSAGCGAVTSDPAGAAAARAAATKFAAAAAALGDSAASVLLAPRANGVLALEIELQRNALNRQLQQFLGSGAPQATAVFFAPTDFSYIDLQGRDGMPGLLQSAAAGGLDSLHTTERIGIGDVSVGAQWMVFDRFQRDTMPIRGGQVRLAVGAAYRFATGRRDTVTNLVDIGTGEGAAVELRSAFDLIQGRLGATLAGRYVKSLSHTALAPLFGDPASGGFPIPELGVRSVTPGDVMTLDVTPRYLLSESFAIDGHYGLERIGAAVYDAASTADAPLYCGMVVSCAAPASAARTAHRLGLGFRYSTVSSYARGTTHFPVEISYTHLETVAGDPGVPKLSREQVQLRLFYRLFGQ